MRQAQLEQQDLLAHRVFKDFLSQDLLVQPAQLVRQAQLDLLEMLVQQVLLAQPVRQVQQAQPVQRVLLVLLEQLEQRVQLDLQVRLVHKAFKGFQ